MSQPFIKDLQATLSIYSASVGREDSIKPHHPITCDHGALHLYEDGVFACPHAEAPPGDIRTINALNQSIAILLFEELLSHDEH